MEKSPVISTKCSKLFEHLFHISLSEDRGDIGDAKFAFRKSMGVIFAIFTLLFTSCSSPLYVVRAGIEEARILIKRRSIETLISDNSTAEELRHKLIIVSMVRDFSSRIGLIPGLSFTTYTDLGRDTLVWVLTACPKSNLEYYTWWYPIVGRVPYKGYFEKEDGLADAQAMSVLGYDYYLRHSPAFSTLGWFNDPLLSTSTVFPIHVLAETVIHEIMHNTVWVSDYVEFNEALASFVGAKGAIDFFSDVSTAKDAQLKIGKNEAIEFRDLVSMEWHDSLIYENYISFLYTQLKTLFDNANSLTTVNEKNKNITNKELTDERDKIYDLAAQYWKEQAGNVISERYKKLSAIRNNAVLLAQRTYYNNLHKLECLYQHLNKDLSKFVDEIKSIAENSRGNSKNPIDLIDDKITSLGLLDCGIARQDLSYKIIEDRCPCL